MAYTYRVSATSILFIRWDWETWTTVATDKTIILTALVFIIFFITDHHLKASTTWRRITPDNITVLLQRVSAGQVLRRVAFLSLAFIPLVLFAFDRLSFPHQNSLLLMACLVQFLWIHLSILWSENRLLTLRRLIPWTIICVAAFSLAQFLAFDELVKLIMRCTLVSLIVGVAAELKLRTFLLGAKYRLAGTLHPNQQAINCALLGLSSLYLLEKGEGNFTAGVTILVIASSFLVLTRSRSTVWAAAAATGLWFLEQSRVLADRTLRSRLNLWQVALWAIIIAALCWLLIGRSFRRKFQSVVVRILLLGRSSPATKRLTGRVPLWHFAIRSASKRLLQGFGYGSFWNEERILKASSLTGWRFSDSHSMYLETLLNTGIIGLGLTVVSLCLLFLKSLSAPQPEGFLLSALTLLIFIHGFLESTFLISNFYSFAFLLLLCSQLNDGMARY